MVGLEDTYKVSFGLTIETYRDQERAPRGGVRSELQLPQGPGVMEAGLDSAET